MLEILVIVLLAACAVLVYDRVREKKAHTAHDTAAHRRIDAQQEEIDALTERLDQVDGTCRGVIRLLDDMKNQRATQQARTVEEVRQELARQMGMPSSTQEEHIPPPARPATSYAHNSL